MIFCIISITCTPFHCNACPELTLGMDCDDEIGNSSEDEDSEVNDSEDITDDEDFLQLVHLVVFSRKRKKFRERTNHFEKWNKQEFYDRFRLSKNTVKYVLGLIKDRISSPTTRNAAVSAEMKLLMTLRYYATGSFLSVCADFIGIHKSTASRCIRLVSHEIALLRPYYISFPQTEVEINEVRQDFFNIARFPKCIGALDCTHIKVLSPGGNNAENYRNRKGFFSINVQTICDSKLRIQDIVARWPGSSHDSTVFLNSSIRRKFEIGAMGDSLLVADSGYALKKYVMIPFEEPAGLGQNRYNEAQIRTRNPVERSYGVWKRRFPILATGINLRLDRVQSIIVATAVLHNIACHFGEPEHKVPLILEKEIKETNSVSVSNVVNSSSSGVRRRENFVSYFLSLPDS